MAAKVTKREREKVFAELAKLSGERPSDNMIERGDKLIIPRGQTIARTITQLEEYDNQQETQTSFDRIFRYRPWDGAAAFERAVMRATGSIGIQKGIESFFGSSPPERHSVNTSPTETISVPWGSVQIPLFDGMASLGQTQDAEYGLLFRISVIAPRRSELAINGFFELIEDELKERSIYRGKAFTAATNPEFLELSGLDPTQVIHSDSTRDQLEANLWSLLRFTPQMRQANLPLKRALLFAGDYGVGKTITAYQTAQIAVKNDWTFVYCRPGKDDLATAIQSALLYPPGLVHIEDIDKLVDTSQPGTDNVSMILDLFDGMVSKGNELVLTLTTNVVDNIHKGMMRPGRIDAMIDFGALGRNGMMRMIEAIVPADERTEELDYDAIYSTMEDYLPAFVREAIDHTRRYALARTGEVGTQLVTEDFIKAGDGLRRQFTRMNAASEGQSKPTLDEAVAGVVAETLDRTMLYGDFDEAALQVQEAPNGSN